jgi:hypothetical protein
MQSRTAFEIRKRSLNLWRNLTSNPPASACTASQIQTGAFSARSNRRWHTAKSIATGCRSIAPVARWAGGPAAGAASLEINDRQREAWCQVVGAFVEGSRRHRQLVLFPADGEVPARADGYGVQVRLGALELHRPLAVVPIGYGFISSTNDRPIER